MRFGDRFLQRWRIAKAARWIPTGARALDIGCADGSLFQLLKSRISEGIGIDPAIEEVNIPPCGRLIRGTFPENLPNALPFDAITMLAVLEHIPIEGQAKLATDCAKYLKPGGRLIITVPSALVDHILVMLKLLRFIDGMSLEEHYGFKPCQTPLIFGQSGLKLIVHNRFQCGLNNLFVFEKQARRLP